MVFSVSLGLIVDNAIHIIYALVRGSYDSYDLYFKTTLVPILVSSKTLIIGFAIFMLYGFLPIRQFGGTLAFTLLMALLSSLFIIPTLVTHQPLLFQHFSPSQPDPKSPLLK